MAYDRLKIRSEKKYEGRFGKIRDEEKTLAVKRLMPENLLNYRFRGTTLPYEELLIAQENIIVDKVTTHSASKVKKIDTSAPMEIGMASGTDGEETFEEGRGRHLNLQCRQCTREQEPNVDGTEDRVPVGAYRNTSTAAKMKKERIVLERDCGPRPEATKEKGKRKVAKVTPESAGAVGKTGHIAANCVKGSWNRSLSERCRRRHRRHQ